MTMESNDDEPPRRRDLPTRRESELTEIVFRNQTYTIGNSRFQDGSLAEVFVDPHKLSCDLTDDARDISVLISIARRYGVPVDVMREALSRSNDGSPTGLASAVLDVLSEE